MRAPPRLTVPLAVVALALALAGGSSARPASATSLHVYSAFAAGGVAHGIHVTKSARGHCWTGSGTDDRVDAWRCFLGNFILDPCFSNPTGPTRFVLCAASPWSGVVKLTLTKPLPRKYGNRPGDLRARPPWAMQLRSGKRCAFLSGATDRIGGLRINYGCTGGGVLVGLPQRRSGTWTIGYAAGFGAKSAARAAVDQAWW